jgi:predicted acylesterase/phospholipase RssA
MFAAISFPGGGNRCYWQGGFWDAAAKPLGFRPEMVVGVSGGAFAACYTLLGKGEEVRALVDAGCRKGLPNYDRSARQRGESPWPVAELYRDLLDTVLTDAALAELKAMTDLRIMISHSPRWLPAKLAAMVGLAGYQLEKQIFRPVHPTIGRKIGFTASYVPIAGLSTGKELADLVYASAAVPPIMRMSVIEGRPALDGGMVDNVPIEPLLPFEAQGQKTLVLLTRRYARHPAVGNRTYVEPSADIRVGQFDITNPDGIREAYALGLRDGQAFVERMRT